MTRYAIVDLEATDTSGTDNEAKQIIQIGIVILENWQIVDTYSSQVNPHEALSESIIELTGLTDEDLVVAPDFVEIIPEILAKLAGSTFVAHNVKFDYGLLSQELMAQGYSLELPRIDTVELARIFFPTVEKYGLESLRSALNIPNHHQHSAFSDAQETAQLLLKTRAAILALPKIVRLELERHSGVLIYETKEFIRNLIDGEETGDDFAFFGPIAYQEALGNQSELERPARSLVTDFKDNLAKLGLKPRKQQANFAQALTESLNSTLPTFIEGQTGIGKTYAYLLTLLAANRRLMVSVPTKILQEQMLQETNQDFLQYFGIRIAKLSAASNYISLKKFRTWLTATSDGKNSEIFKMRVLVWLTQTQTGELSELSRNVTKQEMFDCIAHDQDSKENITGDFDFWQLAEARAKGSDVMIVNHAYLVEHLKKQADFVGKRTLVLDEAQRLFTVLEEAGQEEFDYLSEILKVSLGNTEAAKKKQLLDSLVNHLKQIFEDEKYRTQARQEAESLELPALADFLSDKDKIYWTENNLVKSSPANFSDFKQLTEQVTKAIFISSNIAFTAKKPLLPELLGYADYQFLAVPAQQAENQLLLAVNDGLLIKENKSEDYGQYLADCLEILAQFDLPIISLFTSRQLMEETAAKLEEVDLSYGIQKDQQHDLLKKQFDAAKFQILLATGAFWEGVDFEQQDKLILVIPRLPFATPDDVLTKKFAAKFKNPFYDFNLPMAEMRLRQAFGRVNRRADQKSVVFVLDSRLTGKTYAKQLRKNLADSIRLEEGSLLESLGRMSDFFAE